MFLEINKKKYAIKFGYGAYKRLLKIYNFKKLSDLDKLFKKLNFKANQEPTIEQLDVIGAIVKAGIEYANKDVEIDSDECVNALFTDGSKLVEVMQAFADSQPQPKEGN